MADADTDESVVPTTHPNTASEHVWRAEGRIFGYMLLICVVCACVGFAIGMRKDVPDMEILYVSAIALMLITAYAASIRQFMGLPMGINISTALMLAILWALWLIVLSGVTGLMPMFILPP